jgi:hypothetical protein
VVIQVAPCAHEQRGRLQTQPAAAPAATMRRPRVRPPAGPPRLRDITPIDLPPEYAGAYEALPDALVAGQIRYLQQLQRRRRGGPQAVRVRPRWERYTGLCLLLAVFTVLGVGLWPR